MLKTKTYCLREIHYLKECMADLIFQHGSEEDIMNSIKNKLLTFPEDTVIYPGHGDIGIIGEEKSYYM